MDASDKCEKLESSAHHNAWTCQLGMSDLYNSLTPNRRLKQCYVDGFRYPESFIATLLTNARSTDNLMQIETCITLVALSTCNFPLNCGRTQQVMYDVAPWLLLTLKRVTYVFKTAISLIQVRHMGDYRNHVRRLSRIRHGSTWLGFLPSFQLVQFRQLKEVRSLSTDQAFGIADPYNKSSSEQHLETLSAGIPLESMKA